MKRIIVLLFLMLPYPALAQPADVFMAGRRLPLQVAVVPVYQSFKLGEQTFTETSVPVLVYLPFRRNWGLSVRTAWASASGDALTTLSGATDVQAHLSYYKPVGKSSIVVSVGGNLPSGEQGLTRQEFDTLVLLSRNQYDFQTPSFGLGLGLSPGLSIAFPLSQTLVVGLGAAYQYRGSFEPLENMTDAYDPGDEVLITGGFDARLSPVVSLSADVTYTTYGPDRIGDDAFFEAGDKIVADAQLRHRGYAHEAWLYARYRSRSKNSLVIADSLSVEEAEKTLPNQVEVLAGYRYHLSERFDISLLGELRLFEETVILPDVRTLYGAGLGVEFVVSPRLRLPARFMYQFGDFTGFEVGLGMSTRL